MLDIIVTESGSSNHTIWTFDVYQMCEIHTHFFNEHANCLNDLLPGDFPVSAIIWGSSSVDVVV